MVQGEDQRVAAETAGRFESEELEVVCECADTECAERLPTTVAEYELVREDGARFLVAPGHEDESFEKVVRRRSRYRVVEKVRPRVATLVRRLDPRRV